METGPEDRRRGRAEVLGELRRRGFSASARRGQNFLFDPALLDALIRDSQLPEATRVVEVGAGAGTLTVRLRRAGFPVLTAEIDRLLCRYLTETLRPGRVWLPGGDADAAGEESSVPHSASGKGADRELWLYGGDVLEGKNSLSPGFLASLRGWRCGELALVANLPYAVASPIVQLLLTGPAPPTRIGVLVQEEVARRWCAAPGSRDYGPISVLLARFGRGRITRRVGRQLFSPSPRVDSAFFTWIAGSGRCGPEIIPWCEFVRSLFLHRRKTLRRILRSRVSPQSELWRDLGIDPLSRPEDLTAKSFTVLFEALAGTRRGDGPG